MATTFSFENQPVIPKSLQGLQGFSDNLVYGWDRQVRDLFFRLDQELWESCGHRPKVFLRRVAQDRLNAACEDHAYMEHYHSVMSSVDSYHAQKLHADLTDVLDPDKDLIAYFCAEFGIHESLPIYSGGLGILAGDHCKAASDLCLPFVGVGLLYRQGYFTQQIDGDGVQHALYSDNDFNDLPIKLVNDEQGSPMCLSVPMEGRQVFCHIWQVQVGHVRLFLLDSDLEENSASDRRITYQLYGGERIEQEILLGIGGVMALRALGLKPNVWHINEGHAAFQILERCRELVQSGVGFDTALEQVAAATVYTTHTPVPAGHDRFSTDMMRRYLSDYAQGLGLDMERLLHFGQHGDPHADFNMTLLALRGSRFHNGVSRIHGGVASMMEQQVWPELAPEENPISYVTNGVHVPSFLAQEWIDLFDSRFSDWRAQQLSESFWEKSLATIPDHRYWSIRLELKSRMLVDVLQNVHQRFSRAHYSDAQIRQIGQLVHRPGTRNKLVVGFARRFATYKRATLLFRDLPRLSRLLNDPERPLLFLFAGKAHPADEPGQALIREIHEVSMRPEFVGKIILLEGYDMSLARKLVSGVDVWLNNPEYPMEASGTSGEKAALNGVINLSMMDGWWGEGYNGANGWALYPRDECQTSEDRDNREAGDLLDMLEQQVVPTYFNRDANGIAGDWVAMSKASMSSCMPRYNARRMVLDYVQQFYLKARDHRQQMSLAEAENLAEWKQRMRAHWPAVVFGALQTPVDAVQQGQSLSLCVDVELGSLSTDDVRVECVLNGSGVSSSSSHVYVFEPIEQEGQAWRYQLNMLPDDVGLCHYRIRVYPCNERLAHPFELGMMRWL